MKTSAPGQKPKLTGRCDWSVQIRVKLIRVQQRFVVESIVACMLRPFLREENVLKLCQHYIQAYHALNEY